MQYHAIVYSSVGIYYLCRGGEDINECMWDEVGQEWVAFGNRILPLPAANQAPTSVRLNNHRRTHSMASQCLKTSPYHHRVIEARSISSTVQTWMRSVVLAKPQRCIAKIDPCLGHSCVFAQLDMHVSNAVRSNLTLGMLSLCNIDYDQTSSWYWFDALIALTISSPFVSDTFLYFAMILPSSVLTSRAICAASPQT